MAITAGEIVYKITGDASGLKKGIGTAKKSVSGFSGLLKKAGVAVAGFFAVGKIVDYGKQIIKLGIDAQETTSKFNTVFKAVRAQADSTAQNLAKNFGLSSNASKQLLSDTGDLLTGFGFTGQSALDMSTEVQKLAVDLASFTNFSGGAKGASQALTKALLGERESVKALGISILESEVKAKVKALELSGRFTDQTNKEKRAIATLAIAQEQSANAIGDFARTSGGLANQLRILQARFEDSSTELGTRFIPLLTKGIQLMNDFAGNTSIASKTSRELKAGIDNFTEAQQAYNDSVKEGSKITKAEQASRRGVLAIATSSLKITVSQSERKIAQQKKETAEFIKGTEEREATIKALEEFLINSGENIEEQGIIGGTIDALGKLRGAMKFIPGAGLALSSIFSTTGLSRVEEAQKALEKLRKEAEKASEGLKATPEAEKLVDNAKALLSGRKEVNKELEKSVDLLKQEEDRMNELTESAEKFEAGLANVVAVIAPFVKATTEIFDAIITKTQRNLEDQLEKLEISRQHGLEAIDAQLQAELEARGLAEESEIERLERERDRALELNDEITASGKQKEIDRLLLIAQADKDRLALEEGFEKKKADLEYRAELKSWKLKVAQASVALPLGIMQAILGGFSAPWPLFLVLPAIMGALAAATGGVQLASVIKAKPTKPAFEQGALNIPQDMEAVVHQNEMIIPKPFADDVREGNVVLGSAEGIESAEQSKTMIVQFITNTGELLQEKIFEWSQNGLLKIDAGSLVGVV